MPNEKNQDKVSATPPSKNYPDDEWTGIPEERLTEEEKQTRDRIRGERSQAKQNELEGKEPENPAKLRNQQRPH